MTATPTTDLPSGPPQPPAEPARWTRLTAGLGASLAVFIAAIGGVIGWAIVDINAEGSIFETCTSTYGPSEATASDDESGAAAAAPAVAGEPVINVVVNNGGAAPATIDAPTTATTVAPTTTAATTTVAPDTTAATTTATVPGGADDPPAARAGLPATNVSCSVSLTSPAAIFVFILIVVAALAALRITEASLPGGISLKRSLDAATKVADASAKTAEAAASTVQAATAALNASIDNDVRVSTPITIGDVSSLSDLDRTTTASPELVEVAGFALNGLTGFLAERAARVTGVSRAAAIVFRFDPERKMFIDLADASHRFGAEEPVFDSLWRGQQPLVAANAGAIALTGPSAELSDARIIATQVGSTQAGLVGALLIVVEPAADGTFVAASQYDLALVAVAHADVAETLMTELFGRVNQTGRGGYART